MEETTEHKGLSTLKEVLDRIERRKFPIIKMAHDQDGQRNIVTFDDGSQANLSIEDGWTLRERKDLWKGGAKI